MARSETQNAGGLLFASADTALEDDSRLTASDGGIRTASYVDLERFMGDWYVIACIPTPLERGVRDTVASYRLADDGSIATTFRYRRGPYGRRHTLRLRGFVQDRNSNAIWGMRIVWPIKAEYRVMYVDRNCTQAIVGRSRRDYAWVMSRTPAMSHRDFFRCVRLLREAGYDADQLQLLSHE